MPVSQGTVSRHSWSSYSGLSTVRRGTTPVFREPPGRRGEGVCVSIAVKEGPLSLSHTGAPPAFCHSLSLLLLIWWCRVLGQHTDLSL